MGDTIENSFGNTFVAKTPHGDVKFHFNADKTYSQINPDGSSAKGSWSTANAKITLSPQGGAPVTLDYETNHRVGDTWNAVLADGTPAQVALVSGR